MKIQDGTMGPVRAQKHSLSASALKLRDTVGLPESNREGTQTWMMGETTTSIEIQVPEEN